MTEATDPRQEMLADKEMLRRAASGVASIRVFKWNTVCVTLGSNQSPSQALCDLNAYPWAFRPTGGGAVLHGHDVTLSAVIPSYSRRPNVREVYTQMAQLAIDYLAHHGVNARLAGSQMEVSKPEYCFAGTAPCDVVEEATEIKICGCALRISKQGALLQTSIPFKTPNIDPAEIIKGAKWIGTPEWRPDEDFDPQNLPSWQALITQASE